MEPLNLDCAGVKRPHERLTRGGLELKRLNAEGAGELVQESGDDLGIATECDLR
jgi:hypothetical protein